MKAIKVDTKGRSLVKKRGSKVRVFCQLCGKVVTKAGLVGHMRWSHGRDDKAPMLRVEHPAREARRKAVLWDDVIEHIKRGESAHCHFEGEQLIIDGWMKAEDTALMREACGNKDLTFIYVGQPPKGSFLEKLLKKQS